ncbi:MAG: hypothetical protein M0P17_05440 [Methanoculleus sp.]|nr:hypothetical protein [Methanoculleus sp.]
MIWLMNMLKDKKIYIVINMYNKLNGSIIDCVDLYINLKKLNIDCELIIIYNPYDCKDNTDYSIIMQLKDLIFRYYKLPMVATIMKHIKINNRIKNISGYSTLLTTNKNKSNIINMFDYNTLLDDLIITDYHTCTKYLNKNHEVILISELTLMADLFNKKTNINILKDNYNIKKIIGTKFMKNYCDSDILFEYYMPMSEFRLNNIKIDNNNIIYDNYNNYEADKLNSDFNIHNYAGIKYNRRYLPYHDVCMEAKGKLLFEFLYYNKYVYYNAVPKQDNDGLTDYLNYFNIDDNISQELKITKEEVYNKLIKFDSDNKILNILGQ